MKNVKTFPRVMRTVRCAPYVLRKTHRNLQKSMRISDAENRLIMFAISTVEAIVVMKCIEDIIMGLTYLSLVH